MTTLIRPTPIPVGQLLPENLEVISDFIPFQGEANFAPAILREVKAGVHIAPEVVTTLGDNFVMIHWPKGLPRHETVTTTRFAHGLMRFGETVRQCASRLVREQFGVDIVTARVLEIDSYVDEHQHWHIEPWFHAILEEEPRPGAEAGGVVKFRRGDPLPVHSVWTTEGFEKLLRDHF